MEKIIKKIDADNYIGQVTLTNGNILKVPKITIRKIVLIAKFLGIDAMRMYNDLSKIFNDPSLSDMEKVVMLLESLKEEQLVHIFSILLDMEDEETLALDPNEMLDIILVYLEETNIAKTFTQVRQIYKKMFNRELPDIGEWFNQKAQAAQEIQKKRQAAMQEVEKEAATAGSNS